jgi:hypothetical protein
MTTNTLSPDLEYYMGRLQPQYESAGQAEIGRMLDEYGIPFFYKQATLICQDGRRRIWHPDFTLPTYDNIVIEYNSNGACIPDQAVKGNVYRRNHIAALFLDESDLARPDWQQRLYDRLQELYSQPFAHRCDLLR